MRTERFNRAYDALVKAFFEGTLETGSCRKCAVGNIIARSGWSFNSHLREIDDAHSMSWYDALLFFRSRRAFSPLDEERQAIADAQLTLIGYSIEEVSKIEAAFEEAYDESDGAMDEIETQYYCLCAVVDVLLELDNISPEDHYKNKFREHPQLV